MKRISTCGREWNAPLRLLVNQALQHNNNPPLLRILNVFYFYILSRSLHQTAVLTNGLKQTEQRQSLLVLWHTTCFIVNHRARVGLIFNPGVSCLCTGLFSAAFALSIIHFYLFFFARISLFLYIYIYILFFLEKGAAVRAVKIITLSLPNNFRNGKLWFFSFYYLIK